MTDSLLDKLKVELNQTKRKEMAQKILEIYYDEAANTPLYCATRSIVSRKNVQNVEPEVVREFLRYAGSWKLSIDRE